MPIYFNDRYFCAETRLWSHIIYGRRYINEQIICMCDRKKNVTTYLIGFTHPTSKSAIPRSSGERELQVNPCIVGVAWFLFLLLC